MAAIDPLYAQWLEAETLWHVADDPALKALWGDGGKITSRGTTIALRADAAVEAGRQLAFLGGPLVEEEHLLLGSWVDFLGRVITLTCAQFGYAAGLDVFVIGAQDNRATGVSTVAVLRRL